MTQTDAPRSVGEAVTKMCTLRLLALENVSHSFVVPTVASVLDLVVHTANESNGRWRIGCRRRRTPTPMEALLVLNARHVHLGLRRRKQPCWQRHRGGVRVTPPAGGLVACLLLSRAAGAGSGPGGCGEGRVA